MDFSESQKLRMRDLAGFAPPTPPKQTAPYTTEQLKVRAASGLFDDYVAPPARRLTVQEQRIRQLIGLAPLNEAGAGDEVPGIHAVVGGGWKVVHSDGSVTTHPDVGAAISAFRDGYGQPNADGSARVGNAETPSASKNSPLSVGPKMAATDAPSASSSKQAATGMRSDANTKGGTKTPGAPGLPTPTPGASGGFPRSEQKRDGRRALMEQQTVPMTFAQGQCEVNAAGTITKGPGAGQQLAAWLSGR